MPSKKKSLAHIYAFKEWNNFYAFYRILDSIAIDASLNIGRADACASQYKQ
jgi:hypothetical protein